jgi:hypothetical protein
MAITVVVAIAIWIRSYSVSDYFGVVTVYEDGTTVRSRSAGIVWGTGRIVIAWNATDIRQARAQLGREWFKDNPLGRTWKWSGNAPDSLINLGWNDSFWGRLGFALILSENRPTASVHYRSYKVGIPCWLIASVASIPLLKRGVGALRRRRRLSVGACPSCGYDLRATPAMCPECGWIPA